MARRNGLALLGLLVAATLGLALVTPAHATDGTWNVDAAGNWSLATNWFSSQIADGAGATANLTFNITAGRTITINTTSRTLGILNIGDITTSSNAFTLAATGSATLTFDNGGSNAQLNQVGTSRANTLNSTLPIKLKDSLDIKNAAAAYALTVAGTITASSAGTKTISNLGAGAGGVTLSGGISDGSGSVAVVQNSSTSKLTLSGTNTYTGGTTVTAGTLLFNAAAALPTSGNVAVGSGGVVANGTGVTASALLAKITVTSTGVMGIAAANSETLDFSAYNGLYLGSSGGNYTYSGALTPGSAGYLLGGGGSTLTVTGDLTYATSLTVNGNVTLTPAGTNSYTSALVKSGTLTLGNPGAMGTTVDLTMQGGTLSLNGQSSSWNWSTYSGTGGTITDGGAGVDTTDLTLNTPSGAALGAITQGTRTVSLTKTGAGALTLTTASSTFAGDTTIAAGTLKAGIANALPSGVGKGNVVLDGGASDAGTLDLNGFDLGIGGLSGATGAVLGQVVNNGAGAKNLTVGSNNATTAFAGAIKDNTGSGGTVVLIKTGAGALTLSGTNPYTGATSVNGGKLYVNGSLTASPTVTVASGATLGGRGTVNGAATVSGGGNIEAGQGGTGSLGIGNGLTASGAATAIFGDPSQYATTAGINVTGNLTASGGANSVVLNVPSFPLGTWHLFGYTGTLNDFTAFKLTLPARASGGLVNNTGYVDLNITAFDYLRWVGGGPSPTVWDTVVTGNWKLNSDSSGATYQEGDKVVFDNGATGKTVDVATAAVNPYSVAFENTAGAANDYLLQGAYAIAGATDLAVTGGGKVTIDSAMPNSFTGRVSVKSGTLSIGAVNETSAAGPLGQGTLPTILGGSATTGTLQYTGATAATARTFTLGAEGTGAFDVTTAATTLTVSGVIDGDGDLAKRGDGTLVLSATNLYTGDTTISAGTIQVNAPGAGIPGSSAVSIDTAGTLQWNRAAATDNLTLINAVTGTGTVKIDFANGATGLNTKLAGVNGFAGTIQLSNTGAGGTKDKLSVGTVNAPDASVIIDPGTQVFLNGSAIFKSIQVSGTGNGENRGAIRLTTGSLTVINGLTLMGDTAIGPEGGILNGDISSGAAGTQTLTVGTASSAGNAILNGIIGGGTGAIALTKAAAGTVTLTAANTYTGLTTVSAGTLQIGIGGTTGTLGTNAVSIATGAKLTFNRSDAITVPNQITTTGTGAVSIAMTSVILDNAANTFGQLLFTNASHTVFDIGGGGAILGNGGGIAITTGDNVTIDASGGGTITLFDSGDPANNMDISAAAGKTLTINAVLQGTGGIDCYNSGTLVLTGANTYTGATQLFGTALSVSSINSTGAGWVPSSNMGAPTVNGTINIGGTTNAGTLIYTGTGETTDRVINLAGTTGGGTIDQSGPSGLLKFTSNLTATGAGNKTLTLRGSTAGTGEIAGAIVNSTGTTGVTKTGTGTWTLTNDNNTYTGATTITGGTLIASTIVDGGPSSLGGGTAITLSGAAASNATLKYTGGSVTITRAVTVTNTAGNTGTLEITEPGTKLTINAKVSSGGNYPIFYKDGPGTLELGGGDPAGNTLDNTSLNLQVRQGTVILNKTGLNTNRACARLTSVLAGATVQLGDSSNGDQIYAIVQGMNGTLDMNGQNEAVTEFSSTSGVTTGNVTNTKAATTSILTIGLASTFEGTVTDGAGTVALIKSGTGTLTLAGTTANTYTGMTTVSGGELDLFKTGVNAIGGNVTLSSGTLKFLAAEQIINSALIAQTAGTFDLNGMTETIASYSKSGGTFRTGMGGHLIGAGPTLTFAGGTLLLPDIIDADATVEDAHVVLGSGEVLTALGANDASYGGTPGAVGGILKVAAGGAGLEMTGAALTLNSDSTNAGSLQLFGDVTTLASSATSTIANGAGDSAAVSGLIDLEGGVRTFTVAQGTVPSGEDLSISAVIKNGGLAKDGTGRLVLTGVNTYSGKTTILKGILEIKGAGSIGLSPVIELKAGATLDVTNAVPSLWSLAMGQTLTGGGTVSGNMAVGSGATLSPGGSPGTLTHGPGDETWAGGGTYLWEVNKVDPSVVMQPAGLQGQDPGFDFVSIAGQLLIEATSGQKFTLDIAGLNETTGGEGAVTAWDSLKPYEWVVATAAGGITGFDPDKFDVQWTKFASNNPMAGGTTFIVRQEGNSVVVAYVPEPATLALLGLGGLALLLNRKRK
ncbi:MAG: autotransporter-associated beta strand repeat-containing protein [Planctomycetota bacterium]|nr:autotransporter-associated beta strand repeat-containing protein [Planctomycetota bacterium]